MDDKGNKFELYIQSFLLKDTFYIHSAIRKGITSEWFSQGISYYFSDCILDHYKKYSATLTKDVVRSILEKNEVAESTITLYLNYMDTIYALPEDDHNFEYWFEQLKNEYLGRQLKTTLNVVIDEIKQSHDYNKAVSLLDFKINDLNKIKEDFEEGFTLRDSIEDRWQRYLDVKSNPDKYKGIYCGFREIDQATNGARQGELNLVVARSGFGKSVLLNTIAKNVYLDGHNVMFGGIEMSPEMNLLRLDSSMADLPFNYLRDGSLSAEEEERYRNILEIQKKCANEYYIIPQKLSRTPDLLEMEIRQFLNKYEKLDLLVVDYINIMSLDNTKGMKDHEVQRAIAEELRWLGIKYEIPIWTAAQQTRESKKNNSDEKDTSIISLSDFIGNTTDLCIQLEESKEDRELGLMTCNVIKARYSEKGQFKLRKNFKRMYIGDVDNDFEGVSV